MDTDGDFVVVWHSIGSSGDDTSDWSVQGQRFSSGGIALGAEFQVNSYTPWAQRFPTVASDPDGDFVVVWQNDGDRHDIQGQRFSSAGVALDSEFLVNSFTTSNQSLPVVAAMPDDGFIVAWQSVASAGQLPWISIQSQHFSSGGLPLGSQFRVNSYIASNHFQPAIAGIWDGRFVVVWAIDGSSHGDTSSRGLEGQRFTLCGVFCDGFEAGDSSSWTATVP